ncbi:hypothetical protein [Microcoleus sp. bin38.metabat.b11b12b14.051]|uniref:hypothetical protein n=1 Tax=Microcoleus sp. bin38.metabat.b11b12b14.051 TaxID=2742709 RepID=UPI0025F8C69F|nr:hypothetical protein [Microcoleus sp. bin38.metabat.b11b12b14.051]
MSEKSNPLTASTTADYLIGYERVLDYFKQAQKECPNGIGLKRDRKASGGYITLQFKLGDKRVNKTCGCYLTMQGITDALRKAHLVASALQSFSSESRFLAWYDDVILDKNVIKNDLITFGEAITKVDKEYWEGRTKRRQQRDRSNISQQRTWGAVYGDYYKLLPQYTVVNLTDVLSVVKGKKQGTKCFKNCLGAMKKLAETIGDTELLCRLKEIDGTQTEFREDLQTLSVDDFLKLRNQVLSVSSDKRYHLESRKRWLWVFSMQMVYGFRVHEVFAIQNIDKPFKTKDGVVIPALIEPNNIKMIAVVGDKTLLNTTTKTGYRLCVPMLPPTHSDLIECLELKSGILPDIRTSSNNPKTISGIYSDRAQTILRRWDKGFTQTHALRHLANLNGQMAGMSQETRAKSLGHSTQMNEGIYKKRANTQTTIDLLTQSTKEAIPLGSAIEVLKQLGSDFKNVKLLAAIYGIAPDEVMELLTE